MVELQAAIKQKVSRNDLCPCGLGLKYKNAVDNMSVSDFDTHGIYSVGMLHNKGPVHRTGPLLCYPGARTPEG
ncbi:MAG: SEC-C metal-binding domain-containing protein [Faecousia sp.]